MRSILWLRQRCGLEQTRPAERKHGPGQPPRLVHAPSFAEAPMTSGHLALLERKAWKELAAHHDATKHLHLRQLFADDPDRGQRMALEAVGIYFDYSKNRITDKTPGLLVRLADESGLSAGIHAMFAGV